MSDKFHLDIDNSAHAAALGRLVAHWAVLERHLILILQWLLSTDWKTAMIIYQEFVSTKSKIVLLRRLNNYRNKNKTLKKEIDSYLAHALNLNSERNTFIHALWSTQVKDHIVRIKTIPPFDHKKIEHPWEQLAYQDIQDVVEEISKLSGSLHNLIYRIHGVPPEQPKE